jgi:hypothetical protein
MSMSIQGGGLSDHCTQCREPLEIVAVSFPFLKPCRAVFACSSCGLTFSEDDEGRKRKGRRLRRLNVYRLWTRKTRPATKESPPA